MTNLEWVDLGVDQEIITSLKERGISQPFPIQELTIPDAL
jgi:superfamily II DNA/RNA helicase